MARYDYFDFDYCYWYLYHDDNKNNCDCYYIIIISYFNFFTLYALLYIPDSLICDPLIVLIVSLSRIALFLRLTQ